MRTSIIALAFVSLVSIGGVASAKGCIKGAAVGGVAAPGGDAAAEGGHEAELLAGVPEPDDGVRHRGPCPKRWEGTPGLSSSTAKRAPASGWAARSSSSRPSAALVT